MVEIPEIQGAAGGIETQRDFTGGQRLAVSAAEDRQQHLALERMLGGMPVDIEITRVVGVLSPFKDVEPPGVVGLAHAHVVRHEIKNQAEPMRGESGAEPCESLLVADLGVKAAIIDNVVAVC